VLIPICYRPGVSGTSRRLRANVSGFDSNLYDLANWYMEG
jgi:hypothetical protein